MDKSIVKLIISRLIERANDSLTESEHNKKDLYYEGRKVAYYEVLDIIKSELYVHDQDLEELGLDINLEKEFL